LHKQTRVVLWRSYNYELQSQDKEIKNLGKQSAYFFSKA